MPVTEQQLVQTLEVIKEEQIAAPIDIVFAAVLEEMGPHNRTPDGKPLPMKLEPWPGGRWFRDLGDNTGHWWGSVQVFRPPTLLEIYGPMFMSSPVASNVQYRLSEENGVTQLKLIHRAIGWSVGDIASGTSLGWSNLVENIRQRAERTSQSAGH